MVGKKGNMVMRFGGNVSVWKEILEFEGNFVFLYINTHNKLWENWPASWEINIFLALLESDITLMASIATTMKMLGHIIWVQEWQPLAGESSA